MEPVGDLTRRKSSIKDAASWADQRTVRNCAAKAARARPEDIEWINGLRAAARSIQPSPDRTRVRTWEALDYGCIPIRAIVRFPSGEISTTEVTGFIPGEPDQALFECRLTIKRDHRRHWPPRDE